MKKFLMAFLCASMLLVPSLTQAMDKAPAPATTPAPAAKTAQPAATTKETPRVQPQQVAFIVLDGTGEVTPEMKRRWMYEVKDVFRLPGYAYLKDNKGYVAATQLIGGTNYATADLPSDVLKQIADEAGAQMVALMIVHQMDEYIMHGGIWGYDDGPEMYVRVLSSADLYMYRKDADYMKKLIVRDSDWADMGNQTHPYEIIGEAMHKLAKKMDY